MRSPCQRSRAPPSRLPRAGEFRPDLERLAGTLGVADRVRFLGRIDETTKGRTASTGVGDTLRISKGGLGHNESGGSGERYPRDCVELSRNPRIGSARRKQVSSCPTVTSLRWPHACGTSAASERSSNTWGSLHGAFAEGFTWQNAADETDAHLREVVGKGGGR